MRHDYTDVLCIYRSWRGVRAVRTLDPYWRSLKDLSDTKHCIRRELLPVIYSIAHTRICPASYRAIRKSRHTEKQLRVRNDL